MKRIFLFILLIPVLFLYGCSADDVLSVSGKLQLNVVCAISPIEKFIGDTVQFNLLASINNESISRIEIIEVNGNLKHVDETEKIKLVDTDLALTMDASGYLSRDVSTLMLEDRYVINKDASLYGQILSVKYRVTASNGATDEITASAVVLDYINHTVMAQFPKAVIKNNPIFFDPVDNVGYTSSEYKSNQDKIEFVIYADAANKYYLLNPAAKSTEDLMKSFGLTDYDSSQMRNTKMEKDSKTNYYYIEVDDLEGVSISTSSDILNVATDNVVKFITEDNNHGYLRIKIASSILKIATKMEGVVR